MPNIFFPPFQLPPLYPFQNKKSCGFFLLFFKKKKVGLILPVHFTCDDAVDGQLMIIKTCHSNSKFLTFYRMYTRVREAELGKSCHVKNVVKFFVSFVLFVKFEYGKKKARRRITNSNWFSTLASVSFTCIFNCYTAAGLVTRL